MLRACSKCGKVHSDTFVCTPKIKRKYANTEENRLRSKIVWQKKRELIKERSFYLCSVCKEEGDFSYKPLEVHHIEKLRENPSLFLDDSNLIALCLVHHEQADRGKLKADYLRELAAKRDGRSGNDERSNPGGLIG